MQPLWTQTQVWKSLKEQRYAMPLWSSGTVTSEVSEEWPAPFCTMLELLYDLKIDFVFFSPVIEMVHSLMTMILVASTVIQKPRSVRISTMG